MKRAELIAVLKEGGRLVAMTRGKLIQWHVELVGGEHIKLHELLPIAGVIRDLKPASSRQGDRLVYTYRGETMRMEAICDGLRAGGSLCCRFRGIKGNTEWYFVGADGTRQGWIQDKTALSIIRGWPEGLEYFKENELETWKRVGGAIPTKPVWGACRVCGCTEANACVICAELDGTDPVTCKWVDDTRTLCSAAKCLDFARKQSWFREIVPRPKSV